MDSSSAGNKPLNKSTVTFWDGFAAEIDLDRASKTGVSVKGVAYHNPLKFLEIYGNLTSCAQDANSNRETFHFLNSPGAVERDFMPHIPGVDFKIGESIPQPPFSWKDCDPQALLLNFNYNTNAIYRILCNLIAEGKLPKSALDSLFDRVCLLLSAIYRADNHRIFRNINNNLNMFLISKAVEFVVGKERYDSERQEFDVTRKGLLASLATAREQVSLSVFDKMGYAVGKGVSFIEKGISEGRDLPSVILRTREISSSYCGVKLAIDHRRLFLDMIENAGLRRGRLKLVAIFDDATETVDDLLWIQDLLVLYEFLTLHVLVNTAQISINFCNDMFAPILESPVFAELAAQLGTRFKVSRTYCPFISYQMDYLPPDAKHIIDMADVIFIKGANFFEACQIPNKPVFHAFVVYGPVSRIYTGLAESEAVFAFVPEGRGGYVHSRDIDRIVTLSDAASSTQEASTHSRSCGTTSFEEER